MEKMERIKFQGMVDAGKKRQLEIEFHKSKEPTLQTWNDVVDFCMEKGLEALAKMNQSEAGLYAAKIYGLKRQMVAEEALRRAEYEVQGYVPRDFNKDATVSPIRKVDEG